MSEAEVVELETPEPVSFPGQVWQKLSRIDCSEKVEKKGSGNYTLTYLSWAWAWATLMDHYPESDYLFEEPVTFPDGTQEVWVTVTVREGENALERRMWLPVMDHRNKPIINPTSFQINTTRMRCLAKCLAMFGLGHYIYAGEDIPRPENDAEPVGEQPKTGAMAAVMEDVKYDAGQRDRIVNDIDSCFTQEGEGRNATLECVDETGLNALLEECAGDNDLKLAVWHELPSKVRAYIKIMQGMK